ncbi:MAG: hypothetical protein ACI9UN_001590 [Granulosicoccus sp.]|jgi:hypothetical protein
MHISKNTPTTRIATREMFENQAFLAHNCRSREAPVNFHDGGSGDAQFYGVSDPTFFCMEC